MNPDSKIQSLFSKAGFGPWALDFLEAPAHTRGKLKIVPGFRARGERNQDQRVCRWIKRREIDLATAIVNQRVAAFKAGYDMPGGIEFEHTAKISRKV